MSMLTVLFIRCIYLSLEEGKQVDMHGFIQPRSNSDIVVSDSKKRRGLGRV